MKKQGAGSLEARLLVPSIDFFQPASAGKQSPAQPQPGTTAHVGCARHPLTLSCLEGAGALYFTWTGFVALIRVSRRQTSFAIPHAGCRYLGFCNLRAVLLQPGGHAQLHCSLSFYRNEGQL